MNDKKSTKKKAVKFLLAPRPQKDPLAADFDAPQHVLVPKDGRTIDEIKEKLPDFDPQVFASKEVTRTGMLERAHNADGLTFDSDILEAMSKDFDYNDPNNVLDDDFMDQAGGLIEEEGEMLEGEEMADLDDLFDDEPEIIKFDKDDKDDDANYEDMEDADSDDYDLDQEQAEKSDGSKKPEPFSFGKKLILFKKKINKDATVEPVKEPTRETAHKANVVYKSARQLQDELNAHFNPENQRMLALKEKLKQQMGVQTKDDDDDISDADEDYDDFDDNKTVFTNYSMTSSVMRRSEGLQQIDEHFERLYEKEYADDTEIGALDLNEVKGEQLLTNLEQIRQLKNEVKIARKKNFGDDYQPEIVSDHHKNAIIGEDPAGEEEDLVEVEFKRRENRVDCESILSYSSNLYNHPKLIVEPRKRNSSSRITVDQMEVDDVRSRSDKAHSIASTRASVLSKLSIRPSNETPEDRRARKKALKVYRHERRQERKQNQEIFKSEQTNIIRQQRNNRPAMKLA